jgi:hypothetical protein
MIFSFSCSASDGPLGSRLADRSPQTLLIISALCNWAHQLVAEQQQVTAFLFIGGVAEIYARMKYRPAAHKRVHEW